MKLIDFFSNKNKKEISDLPTALASYPRSGNTWLRFLIEEVTGQKTGSVYVDRILTRDKNGIVVKTHELDPFNYSKAVYVIRNPFDCIHSYYFWKRDIAKEDISWDTHFSAEVLNWKKHTELWTYYKIPKIVIRYEDLKNNTIINLKHLFNWLEIETNEEDLLKILKLNTIEELRKKEPVYGESFFRKGEIGSSAIAFSNEQKEYLENELKDWLIFYNYLK